MVACDGYNEVERKSILRDFSDRSNIKTDTKGTSHPGDTVELTRDALRAALLENAGRVPNWSWQQDDVFIRFNADGQRTSLYWCFNNWMEPIRLSQALHPEQPLVAMHSLHQILKGKAVKAANLRCVSEIYADGIMKRAAGQPVTIGGNCQAGPIAEAVAHRILEQTNVAPKLVFLDHMPQHDYPGTAMLLFGSKSEKYNPFLRGIDPVPRWQAQFGQHSCHLLDAGHGMYFREPAVEQLVGHVTGTLAAEGCP